MQPLSTPAIAAVFLLISGIAHADRRDRDFSAHDSRPHRQQTPAVRLDVPIQIRGDRRIHLRRLINHYYGIDLDHYRIREVIIDHDGNRRALARLRVGRDVTPPVHLYRGRNVIFGPNHGYGHWVLGFDNARVDHIGVVLEPKRDWAYRHGSR